MKRTLTIAALAGLAFASCKKDYTCNCTTTDGITSISQPYTLHGTKSDAKTACDAGNKTDGTIVSTCVIE